MVFTADATRAELRRHVLDIAATAPEDSRKAALRFTASVLKLPYARVKAWFYDEVRRVEAHEADQIRAYYEAAHKLIEARAQYEKPAPNILKRLLRAWRDWHRLRQAERTFKRIQKRRW